MILNLHILFFLTIANALNQADGNMSKYTALSRAQLSFEYLHTNRLVFFKMSYIQQN